jgi:hypothetical protein
LAALHSEGIGTFLGEKIPVSIPEEGIKSKGLHDTVMNVMNVSAGVEETCSITYN